MSCPYRTHAAMIVLAGALVAGPSFAAPTDAIEHARQLFGQAEADEDAERWLAALDKLHAVAQVKLTAGVRYHLALCEEHLGQLARALGDYRAAEDQARFEGAKDVLRLVGKQLATLEPRVPRLIVHVVPPLPGASMKIDGEPIASAMPSPAIPVDPGVHFIEVDAPGRTASTATVTLQEHEARSLDLSPGEPLPPPAQTPTSTATPSPPPAPPATATQGPTSPREPTNPTASSPAPPAVNSLAGYPIPPAPATSPPARGLAIVATATAIALAGGGIAAYLIAGTEHDRDVNTCKITATTLQSACDGLKNRVRAWDFAAAGAWAGALVAGATALVLWTKAGDTTATVGVRIRPTPFGLEGQF